MTPLSLTSCSGRRWRLHIHAIQRRILCSSVPHKPAAPSTNTGGNELGRRHVRNRPSAPQQGAAPPPAHLSEREASQAAVSRSASSLPSQDRPRLSMPVVVEGHNDRHAVQRAVHAQVYVLGGATTPDQDRVLEELGRLRAQYGGLVILTDSDVAGRQARNFLESRLPGCYHAFVPAPLATSASGTTWHAAGNVGVEHAPPRAILRALQRMRPGNAQRKEFSREQLVELGLVAPHHLSTGGRFAARRELVCAYLGIGNCDGKQLLRQLNSYGFLHEDLEGAMRWARDQQQQQQPDAQER